MLYKCVLKEGFCKMHSPCCTEMACDPTRTADVAAIVMHEGKCGL